MGEHYRVTISAFLAPYLRKHVSDPTTAVFYDRWTRTEDHSVLLSIFPCTSTDNVTDVGRDYNKVTS